MRILILSNSASSHTQKWVKGLTAAGIQVGVFSLNRSEPNWYAGIKNISILHEPGVNKNNAKLTAKIGYLKNVTHLKNCIALFKPDIVHAHYATSYGLLGALSAFKPFFISVWGSDVYDFPRKSYLHKLILKVILSKASTICSTSISMKTETQKYTKAPIEVIPFGIDSSYFNVENERRESITIGLIKSLEPKYGIDILIKTFASVLEKYPSKQISLLLVGDGSKKAEYIELTKSLGISDKVKFTGKVAHEEVIKYHQLIDIFVSLSVLDSESFGVSLVEAMAMEKPVVASDVSGFKEVLGTDLCGIIVTRNSVDEAANAISKYIDDPEFARSMGLKAKKRAFELYNWNNNLEAMINLYKKALPASK